MTKAALLVLVIEVLAACILIHRLIRLVGKGIAVHRAKQAGSAGVPR